MATQGLDKYCTPEGVGTSSETRTFQEYSTEGSAEPPRGTA